MTVTVSIWTDLPEIGARFEAAGAAMPGIVASSILEVGEVARGILDTEVRAATPKLTGALADSTETTVTGGGGGATIESHQPLQVHSSRASWLLARLRIDGYTTGEIIPVSGGALMWPGLDHPVKRSAGSSWGGSDYGKEALDASMPAVDDMLGAKGFEILERVTSIL